MGINKRIKFFAVICSLVVSILGCSLSTGVEANAAANKYKYVTKCLGTYRITHYTGGTKTASGTRPKAGRTIGVNPKQIKYGTKVKIQGKWYVAEDTGGAMRYHKKLIDVYVKSRSEAYKKGVKHKKVYVKVKTKVKKKTTKKVA